MWLDLGSDGDLGYGRVSSEEQAKGHSPDHQVNRLKAAGCTRFWMDTESAYKQGAYRPGFEEMLEYIQSERVRGKTLYITDFDRLSRNEARSFTVFELLDEHGIKLVSLNQPYIDLSDPDGRVMAGQQVIQARAYSARLSKRVKQGHQDHRDRNAAYFAPFGYVKVGDSLRLDHSLYLCLIDGKKELSRAAIARELVEWFLECRTIRRTLLRLNETYGVMNFSRAKTEQPKANRKPKGSLSFSLAGFVSWLNNPILRGHLSYGRAYRQRQRHKHLWDIRYNTHPNERLMSDEEYREIEQILDWNSQHGGFAYKTDLIHPFSGLMFCGECLARCAVHHYRLRSDPTIKKFSYQCKNYRQRTCSQKKMVRHDAIEPVVIAALIQRAEAITTIAETPPSTLLSPEIQALQNELAFYESAPGDRAAAIIADIQQQIEMHQKRLVSESEQDSANRDLLLQYFSNPIYWEHGLTDSEKRDVYRALVDRVVIRAGQVEQVILKV